MHQVSETHNIPAVSRRVKTGLIVVMALLALATVISLWTIRPREGELPPKTPYLTGDASYASGEVVGFEQAADGEHVVLKLDSGEQVTLEIVGEVPSTDFRLGDRVRAVRFPDAAKGSVYVFMDFYRGPPLLALALIFVAAVLLVARFKGLAALGGLIGALAMIWFFLLPALLAGRDPLQSALTVASAVMFTVVYLAHGISIKSTTALLGTFFGTAIVALIAWWAIPNTHLMPLADEAMVQLSWVAPRIDLKAVLLSGMVLAGVGVLNDVTITQASAVWELRAAAPSASRRSVFMRSMRIGRDHIASTVYTIAFAYIGGAMALLLYASTLDHTLADLLTFDVIASELVPILAASIGLVLAIPLTSAIGTWLVGGPREGSPAPEAGQQPQPDTIKSQT